MSHPLYVAFYWHMHQPYYRDTVTGDYTLPWVRLHATKDYLHMVNVLREFPAIHQTFNLVPCLIEQLEDYAHGGAADRCLRISEKQHLTDDDRRFILSFFFNISWDRVIARYPRYWQLLQLKNQINNEISYLSDQYFRDLIVWFNLAWIDPTMLHRDPVLNALIEKGGNFTQDDITTIIGKHREICGAVVPTYRQMEESGQIEVTTSPYFHPILPLLVDNRAAAQASPHMPLPEVLFSYPEDASEQLRRSYDLHQRYFGRFPGGLWPSEGAVSQDTIALLRSRHSVDWLASDEGVLGRSTGAWFERDGYGHLINPRPICQPYRLGSQGPTIVFRDHVLSDRIGFVYKGMGARDAAGDLIHRLYRIKENINDSDNPYLVSIILDGENCWEQYENNGDDFLRQLYGMLSENHDIKTVTIGEYLRQFPARSELTNLVAGSWISSNLETWIGEREQNRAWEYLSRTRERLIAWELQNPLADFATLERAWQEIYIAEGSDWFWWYYSHNKYGNEQLFDQEFRTHLGNVFLIMGLPIPEWLKQTILQPGEAPSTDITAYISPRLGVGATASVEWTGAGYVDPRVAGAAMQISNSILKRLYYGYSPAELFIRLESNENIAQYFVGFYFSVSNRERANQNTRYGANCCVADGRFAPNFELAIEPGNNTPILSEASGQGSWQLIKGLRTTAIGQQTIEVSIPFTDLDIGLGDIVDLFVVVSRDGVDVAALPTSGYVSFTLTGRA